MTRLSQLLAGLWLVLLSCSCLPTHLLAQTYVSYQGFQPYSLTFDSAGHLWVLDGASFNILQMSGTGGELSRVDVSQLEPPMECPQSMRMDSGGNFFIVDSCNSLVYVVSPKGVLLNMLSTTDPELQYPTGLALDAQGNVYVGDQGNQRVVKFNAAGAEVMDFFDTLWGSRYGGQMEPGSIALDSAGNLYICDWANYVVISLDPQGNQRLIFNITHALQANERFFWIPETVVVDAAGNVWVSSFIEDYFLTQGGGLLSGFTFSYYLTKFAPNGTLLLQFNSTDTAVAQLDPNDLAVDAQGYLWAADTWNGRVVQISPQGKEVQSYTLGTLPFVEPLGVAVDSAGNMLVADGELSAILKLSSTGQVLSRFPISPDKSTVWPSGIALDAQDCIYVSDEDNSRVLKLSPQGALLQIFNTTKPPLSYWIRGLTVDAANNVYVADAELNRVVKWAPNGTHVYSYTGSFRYPADVRVDAQGNVWVLDQDKERVVKFLNNGSLVGSYTANPSLTYPEGLLIDPNTGFIYVADEGNGRVVILDPTTGATLATIAPTGVPMCPYRLAMNKAGDLLVTDPCADRLIVFQLSTSPPHWLVAPTATWSSSSGVSGGALAGVIIGCVLGGSLLTCLVLALAWCACGREGGLSKRGVVKEGGNQQGGKLQFTRQSDDDVDNTDSASQAVEMS